MFLFDDLAYAHGKPATSAIFKASPEDFRVDEDLGFEASGEGEHLFLHIEKRGVNTEELVKHLSRLLDKSPKLISYAGLKDRQAITTQWLSIHTPGLEIPEAEGLEGPGFKVLKTARHSRKLKTGFLAGNRFTLTLREVNDPAALETRLLLIQKEGVPNYFGPQRFGHEGQNLQRAEKMLFEKMKVKDRFLKGIYLSAARSGLFNLICSARVAGNSWNQVISGDICQLAGTHSIFSVADVDESIKMRTDSFDISPAAPLWGKGEERVSAEALSIQNRVLEPLEKWCAALIEQRLERAYRPLRLQAENMSWSWDNNQLTLAFNLTAGSYATSVLRELVHTD